MSTTKIDPVRTLDVIDERYAAESDPGNKRMLELAKERLVGEMIGDLPRLLGAINDSFEMISRPAGQEEVRSDAAGFREALAGLCSSDAMIWVDWDHIVLQNDVFMADAVVNTMMGAEAAGVELEPGEDPGTKVVVSTRGVVIIEHADGLQAREIFYSDPATAQKTKLAPGDAPTREAAAEALGVPAA